MMADIIKKIKRIRSRNGKTGMACLLAGAVSFYSTMAEAQDRLYANEFPLGDVTLLDGPFKTARDLNVKTLLAYKVDRLLAPYRKEAGLPLKDSSFRNWEGLDGHVGGHYLSALAMNAGVNADCRKRMLYMVAELKACQDANAVNNKDWGIGYAGGVPNSRNVWVSAQNGSLGAFRDAWVPWYNVHKTYAGLRDVWLYTRNEEVKNIFLKFCDWAIAITAPLTDAQMQQMLDMEHGGMNEIFADAYAMTGSQKYLAAAKRFSHHMLLEPMAEGNDNLDNKHANTQVPKAVGFARIGELSGDKEYKEAGSFFWQTVVDNRTLAFGGNSRREFFPSKAACTDFLDDVEGPETCNSNNMLKLTEDLFRMNPLAKYADYYERTMLNHILSTQNPETGGFVYFTPVRPRSYRVYSAPNEAMWCCVGTGMENHGKYSQFIYTHRHDSLFVNLFVASVLNWKEKGMMLKQETAFPYKEKTKLTITQSTSPVTLMLRYPGWVAEGGLKIRVNGKPVAYTSQPSSYIAVKRAWKKGDVVEIDLPMHNTVLPLPNVPSYIALMHGPVLLGAKTGTEDLRGLIADDGRWGHIAGGEKLPLNEAPILVEDNLQSLAESLQPVTGKPLRFTFRNVKMANPAEVTLEPFYGIHNARYMIYWMRLNSGQYKSYADSLAAVEKEKLALEKRTVDAVVPGEQQPEVDHALQSDKSDKGFIQDKAFRKAGKGGYFSYNLATGKETGLSLMVRYWGSEWGSRKFTIYIDDQKLVTEDNTDKWKQSRFFDIVYAIPDSLLQGKDHVRVKFEAEDDSETSPVYDVRLLRAK